MVSPPIEVGDVVEVPQHPGERWAVVAPAVNAVPPNRMWHLRRERPNQPTTTHTAGDGDIVVVDHPIFSAGQIVNYDFAYGGTAQVISDDGITVRISFKSRRPRSLDRETGPGIDGATFQTVELVAHRGHLVAMNL